MSKTIFPLFFALFFLKITPTTAQIRIKDNSILFISDTILPIVKGIPIVFVILGAECPISQKYTARIEQLRKNFPIAQFIGIFTKSEKKQDIAQFCADYAIHFPVFLDGNNDFLRLLGAKVMPQCFVVAYTGYQNQYKMVYQGAIDNWYYALGKYRTVITKNYLEDALQSVLNHQNVIVKRTEAVGCVIEQN